MSHRRAEYAASFDRAAGVYARARPSYPAAALDWLLPDGARSVLDLGAGTGKLTAQLAARGLDVVAVEPSERMRDELESSLPKVRSLAGSAEAIPLDDRTVDAVLVAQAWHWVDPVRAVPEVARVLRPGGRLGLLWNCRDEREPWVAVYGAILARPGEATDAARAVAEHARLGAPFGPTEHFDTDVWHDTVTREGLVELAASRSYVITLDEDARRRLLELVRELLATHPDLVGRATLTMPYVTECVRADLVRPSAEAESPDTHTTPAGSG